MPAEPMRALPQAARTALDQRRRSARRACGFTVKLRIDGKDCSATLLDLSAEGAGLRTDALLPLRAGMRLMLIHPQLGEVPGVLRWAMRPRYGVEFEATYHALAGVRAVYDSLSRAPGDII